MNKHIERLRAQLKILKALQETLGNEVNGQVITAACRLRQEIAMIQDKIVMKDSGKAVFSVKGFCDIA